jgi:hypothetical protein
MKGLVQNKATKNKKSARSHEQLNDELPAIDPRILRALLEGVDEPAGVLAGRK